MKEVAGKVLLIISSCLLGLLFCEIILRVYNPLPSRIKGDSIKLLANYERTIDLKHAGITDLDESIHYSTNSIGFRGDEPPVPFEDFYTVITVGGSTTECSLLDDSKTWAHVLQKLLLQNLDNIWINNAGIDGCSTFGHQVLLSEHVFKLNPDMIIFLVGVNEMHVAKSNYGDNFLETAREYKLRKLSQKSELCAFLWNLYRLNYSKKIKAEHGSKRELPELAKKEFEEKHEFYLNDQRAYKKRLKSIVKECIERGITPVLVTQPIYNLTEYNRFSFVPFYNQTTIEVGHDNNVFVIDLASKLESIPGYYYDPVHYTNQGAKEVARIIYNDLKRNSHFQQEVNNH